MQTTQRPASTPTVSATSTATSTNQVGACLGPMWDAAGLSAPTAAIPISGANDSFGLANISFGSSLVQAVDSLNVSLLSSLASASGD